MTFSEPTACRKGLTKSVILARSITLFMYYRFGKAFYFVSILVFIFFLLYFYSAMPDQVGISMDESGAINRDWEKGDFFYGMITFFVILNAITLYTPKSLETKANKKMHRIFPIGDPYRDYILAWFYSFGGIVNLSLGILALYVHAINNQEEIGATSYNLWFFLMPILLVVWVVALFVLLVGKFKAVQRS